MNQCLNDGCGKETARKFCSKSCYIQYAETKRFKQGDSDLDFEDFKERNRLITEARKGDIEAQSALRGQYGIRGLLSKPCATMEEANNNMVRF